eukprot:SRR837773.11544.p1 GENE.SRR837773.11544~~SRR837773.11544.p1  ORF type:complete len:181 (-),score=41.57 SRR837773.11544:21-563(-)
MDWGLGRRELFGAPVEIKSREVTAVSLDTVGAGTSMVRTGQEPNARTPLQRSPPNGGAQLSPSALSAGLPSALSESPGRSEGTRTFQARGQGQRRFGRRIYWAAVLLDMLGRLTWVLALLPINIISDDVVQRSVIEMGTTIVEIVRRSMWSVLRIEYEQVSNASGFRALLWVPMLMKGEQ